MVPADFNGPSPQRDGFGLPACRVVVLSQKIERVGTLNYPEAAKNQKIYGSLQLTVSIKPDGTVDAIEINRSSGQKVLDDAARRIVQLAAPYAAFPVDIAKDTDILSITRTWTFTRADQLFTE